MQLINGQLLELCPPTHAPSRVFKASQQCTLLRISLSVAVVRTSSAGARGMPWRWCLLLLTLSAAAAAQVQPARNLQTFGVDKRRVSYTFTASTTPEASYKLTFTTNRTGITPPATQVLSRAGFRTISGLTPDVDYTLQVVAVRNGAESTAISADFTTLPDVPSGPPQNLRVSSRTTTSITLTWSGPALDRINDKDGVTGFVVKKNGVQVAKVTELLSSPSITFTGLRPAESYAIEVLAVNDQGTAPPNHAARLTATTASGVPGSPTLRVVLPRFSNTYLVWSDPEPFVGPITGFQIRYLIDGVPLTIPELSGGVHQYSVSGIKGSKGKTHSVSLRAKTAAGYGDYSEPVVFTFQPIAEVDVTAVDCSTLKVSYTVNPLPGGDKNKASLQSFVVKYQPILGGGSTVTRTVPLNGKPADGVLCLSGLRPDTPYRVTYNVEVNPGVQIVLPSDLADPKQLFTLRNCGRQVQQCIETRTAPPSPPTLRVVLPRFSNTYLVWSDPEPFVGNITGFQIRYLINGVPLPILELGGEVHQYSVSGIEGSEGKTHSVSLRAKTVAGYGDYSEAFVFIFQPIVEVNVTSVDCETLKVNYTVNSLPGGDKNKAFLGFLVVEYYPVSEPNSTRTRIVQLNGLSAEGMLCLTDLLPNTAYNVTYSVKVTDSQNLTLSEVAGFVVESTAEYCYLPGLCFEANSNVPDVPAQHVRVDKINSHTLEVSWLEPDPRHIKPGFEITGYRIIVGSSCGEGINKTVPAAQSRWYSVRFPHLEPGTTYCVRVVPGNIAGFALPQSVQSSDYTVDLPEIMPAPLIAGVTPHEHHAIVIWGKVESGDKKNPVTEYIIQIETYFDGERMVYRRMFSSSDVQYFFNMTQLAAGRLYAVSVAAQNRLGMGRVGSTTFRTLLLTDVAKAKTKSSSILPLGHNEQAPDMGDHWNGQAPEDFTLTPDTIFRSLNSLNLVNSLNYTSTIGPFLKLYQGITRPQYRVPVASEEVGLPKKMSLCYEVQGQVNQTFNLISDTCVSVNALYSPTTSEGTSIGKIGVLAKDNGGQCQEIEVDLAECEVRVNGQVVKSTYKQDGVDVRHRGNGRVRIAVPNCKDVSVVMWLYCQGTEEQPIFPFEITRGRGQGNTSHGLVGQFWNTKVVAEGYNVTADDHIEPDPNHYAVTVTSRSGNTRKFFASRVLHKWDKHSNKCLYAGGPQGGRIYEVPSLPGSAIEGRYDEYAVDGLFDHDYKYSQFASQCP